VLISGNAFVIMTQHPELSPQIRSTGDTSLEDDQGVTKFDIRWNPLYTLGLLSGPLPNIPLLCPTTAPPVTTNSLSTHYLWALSTSPLVANAPSKSGQAFATSIEDVLVECNFVRPTSRGWHIAFEDHCTHQPGSLVICAHAHIPIGDLLQDSAGLVRRNFSHFLVGRMASTTSKSSSYLDSLPSCISTESFAFTRQYVHIFAFAISSHLHLSLFSLFLFGDLKYLGMAG